MRSLFPDICSDDLPASRAFYVDLFGVHACTAVDAPPATLPTAHVDKLPGGTMAWLTHRGPYEELGLAYHALHAWVQEHGHEPCDLVREIDINDPADVPPEALVTELWLPLRR